MGLIAAGKMRSGTREWVFQRVSNLLICAWGAVFIAQLMLLGEASYASWLSLFQPLWFKVFSTCVLSFITLNSVLAGWQIGADYVKASMPNKLYMLVCIVGSAAYFTVGLYILWVL